MTLNARFILKCALRTACLTYVRCGFWIRPQQRIAWDYIFTSTLCDFFAISTNRNVSPPTSLLHSVVTWLLWRQVRVVITTGQRCDASPYPDISPVLRLISVSIAIPTCSWFVPSYPADTATSRPILIVQLLFDRYI